MKFPPSSSPAEAGHTSSAEGVEQQDDRGYKEPNKREVKKI